MSNLFRRRRRSSVKELLWNTPPTATLSTGKHRRDSPPSPSNLPVVIINEKNQQQQQQPAVQHPISTAQSRGLTELASLEQLNPSSLPLQKPRTKQQQMVSLLLDNAENDLPLLEECDFETLCQELVKQPFGLRFTDPSTLPTQ